MKKMRIFSLLCAGAAMFGCAGLSSFAAEKFQADLFEGQWFSFGESGEHQIYIPVEWNPEGSDGSVAGVTDTIRFSFQPYAELAPEEVAEDSQKYFDYMSSYVGTTDAVMETHKGNNLEVSSQLFTLPNQLIQSAIIKDQTGAEYLSLVFGVYSDETDMESLAQVIQNSLISMTYSEDEEEETETADAEEMTEAEETADAEEMTEAEETADAEEMTEAEETADAEEMTETEETAETEEMTEAVTETTADTAEEEIPILQLEPETETPVLVLEDQTNTKQTVIELSGYDGYFVSATNNPIYVYKELFDSAKIQLASENNSQITLYVDKSVLAGNQIMGHTVLMGNEYWVDMSTLIETSAPQPQIQWVPQTETQTIVVPQPVTQGQQQNTVTVPQPTTNGQQQGENNSLDSDLLLQDQLAYDQDAYLRDLMAAEGDTSFYKDGRVVRRGEYILPQSSTEYLSDALIDQLTTKGICYAKNEIYAKHGRGFKSKELKDYFSSQPWYLEIYSPGSTTDSIGDYDTYIVTNLMNAYEQSNKDKLSAAEGNRGYYQLDQ